MIENLPVWNFNNLKPSFNDLESATAVEMVYKLYGKNRELIDDYLKFVEDIKNEIKVFQDSTNQDLECFKENITKICNDYIATMDMKIDCQDRKIAEIYEYLKENLTSTITTMISEMKESGELEEIILDALDNVNTKINSLEEKMNNKIANLHFDNVEEMKKTTLEENDIVQTLGYYNVNDGGGATYKIVRETEQNKHYENLENGLYAELIVESKMKPEQFGAYGDNEHDDTYAIQKAVNIGVNLYFSKTYIVNGEIQINKAITINGINGSTIKGNISNKQSVFHVLNDNVRFNDLNIDVTYTNPNANAQYGGAITIGSYYMENGMNLKNIKLNGLKISKNITDGFTIGIFGDSHNIDISNCNVNKNGIGIHWSGNFLEGHTPAIKQSYHPHNIKISNCFFENDMGVYCSGAYNVIMENLDFKNNLSCIQLVAGDVGEYLLESNMKNKILKGIKIDNCNFNDCTDHTVFLKGYGTWINGDNTYNPIKNTEIKFTNCSFNDSETNTAGALLRVDYIKGLSLENCTFIANKRANALYGTILMNAILNNCYFKVPGEPITIFGGNKINVKNCNAELNPNHSFVRTTKYKFSPENQNYNVSELFVENNVAENGFNILSLTNTFNTVIKHNQFLRGAQGINYLDDNHFSIVEGNKFSEVSDEYVAGHYNIRAYKVENIIIKDNYLEGSTGILADVNSSNIKITDNYMNDVFASQGSMIEIPSRSTKDVYLLGNKSDKSKYVNGVDYHYIDYIEKV